MALPDYWSERVWEQFIKDVDLEDRSTLKKTINAFKKWAGYTPSQKQKSFIKQSYKPPIYVPKVGKKPVAYLRGGKTQVRWKDNKGKFTKTPRLPQGYSIVKYTDQYGKPQYRWQKNGKFSKPPRIFR